MIKKSSQQCYSSLDHLFDQQTAMIQTITTYLDEIKNNIARNDITALTLLLTDKKIPINELETMENHRHDLLNSVGFEPNKAGMESCIAWCDSNGGLEKKYQCLTQALMQLQKAIQVNGLLVNKGQNRIRRSLHLLTGQGDTDQPKTYSSKGVTQPASSKRSITLA